MTGGFVLNTTTLPSGLLARHHLKAGDILYDAAQPSFDHLPVVVDLVPVRQSRP